MRTTVYVADPLWQTAEAVEPTMGASALVQAGLKALLREHDDADPAFVAEVIDDLAIEHGEAWRSQLNAVILGGEDGGME